MWIWRMSFVPNFITGPLVLKAVTFFNDFLLHTESVAGLNVINSYDLMVTFYLLNFITYCHCIIRLRVNHMSNVKICFIPAWCAVWLIRICFSQYRMLIDEVLLLMCVMYYKNLNTCWNPILEAVFGFRFIPYSSVIGETFGLWIVILAPASVLKLRGV